MPSIGHFIDILEAISRRDWSAIERIGHSVAEEERKKRHFQAAHRISEAIEIAVAQTGLNDLVGTVSSPAPALTGTPFDLLHEEPATDIAAPVLPLKIQRQVNEFIGEWRHEARLRNKGISPQHTVLLHGPPGCGKTHLSKYLAQALEMRLFVIRFDSLISSFLGETGSNLRRVFEFVSANRCALFIDELDAIAKMRDDRNELGELKRIVISLLQNLDISQNRSLIIAATNHPHMLDAALWRRFEVVWELDPPKEQQRVAIFERYLSITFPQDVHQYLSESTEGLTGSDIFQICQAVKRKAVLDSSPNPTKHMFTAILDFLRRGPSFGTKKPKIDNRRIAAALSLKALFSDEFSFQDLENISGVAHSTLHHRFNQLRQDSVGRS